MKRKLLMLCLIVLSMTGCKNGHHDEEWPYYGIPEGSYLMDGNTENMLFLEVDTVSDMERLWIYEIATKEAECFLTCHKHYGPGGYSGEDGRVWPRDSISDICYARFVKYGSKTVVVGEAAPTYMNVYIVSDSDAIYLCGALRYMGRLFNNGWYVTEYRTYGTDTINSILYYYDENGKLMRTDTCVVN